MREIKFKFWNAIVKEMEFDRKYIPWADEEIGVEAFFNTDEEHPDSVWLQWTGLKDRHGVNIYEGDVVKRKHFGSMEKFIVVFEGGFFLKDNANELWGIESVSGTEVVGNVFESPYWSVET